MPTPDQMKKAAPAPVNPEMQAAIDQNAKNLANPSPAPILNATQAGTLGLGGTEHVVPTDAEVAAATTPVDPTVRGYQDTGLKAHDIQPPLVVPPDGSGIDPIVTTANAGGAPVVGKQAPTTKAMLAKVLSGNSGPGQPTAETGFNFADLLKGAGPKLGDALQRWGMGLMGAPTGETQGDIQRRQQFELNKQLAAAQVQAQAQAAENEYAKQRMELQNQMNMANLPIEKKAELDNQIKLLDASIVKQRIEYEQQYRMWSLGRTVNDQADPNVFWKSGGK